MQTAEELAAYSRYAQLLVGDDGRNSGECGVLALAEVHNLTAVLDDHAAHKAAARNNVTARRTLGLLCDAIDSRLVTVETANAVADALLRSDYRLPFPTGEFVRWARDNGRIGTS